MNKIRKSTGLALAMACLSSGSAYGMNQLDRQIFLFEEKYLCPCQKVDPSKATPEELRESIACIKGISTEGFDRFHQIIVRDWIVRREGLLAKKLSV